MDPFFFGTCGVKFVNTVPRNCTDCTAVIGIYEVIKSTRAAMLDCPLFTLFVSPLFVGVPSMAAPILIMLLLFIFVICKIYGLLSPRHMKQIMLSQGLQGPNPKFLLGNLLDIKKIVDKTWKQHKHAAMHNLEHLFFPYFVDWKKTYGKSFVYWLGIEAVLYVQEPELIQDISSSGSFNWGRPGFLKTDRFPLFGNGLIMAEDHDWFHQRRIVGQALSAENLKGLLGLVMDASLPILNDWAFRIMKCGREGVEIEVDGELNKITGHVISKLLFGSSYREGFEILDQLKALQHALFKATRFVGVPGSRFIPWGGNKDVWRLGKKANFLILQIINARLDCNMKGLEDDLLGLFLRELNHAKGLTLQDIVDECKTLLIAGQETTKLSLTWTLMLLALNPHWQDRVRAEVLDITKGGHPDNNMLSKMKIMTMVINESMRLYPPVSYTVRQAKQDVKMRNLKIPKGMSMLINILGMHEDPQLWGRRDVYEFNPERFSNIEATKKNNGYIPFGFGGRICPGEKVARLEQKAILSLILSRFSFTMSPNYVHSPKSLLSIMPSNGMQLIFTSL